ncbi:MAG TPA: hypothetical protein VJ953_06430 [Saprospiraceae bacterium]|nr:hypothetical protein [Saprospiraceae bacterium]
MLQNKVTQLLQLLAYPQAGQKMTTRTYRKEIQSLREFLVYQSTNRDHKQALALFDLLQTFGPDFEAKDLSLDSLYRQLFPKGKASKSYFRKVQSTLSRLIEDYLIQQKVREDATERSALLTKVYQQRGQQDWYVKLLIQQKETLLAKEAKGTTDFRQLAECDRQLYEAQVASLSHAESTALLRDFEKHLERYYLLEQLILWNEWAEFERVTQERKQVLTDDLLQQDLTWLIEQIRQLAPQLLVFELYLSRLEQADQSRLLTKEAILDTHSPLSQRDRQRLFMWLVNDTNRYLRQGADPKAVYTELLELYRFGLQKDLLWSAGHLSSTTYFNVVTVSNLLGEYDFCYQFIETYTKDLREGHRAAAENWAMAHYYYHTDDLEGCLERVGTAYKKYDMYSLQIRTLEVKSRYTLFQRGNADVDFLDSCLANALQWANNDRIFSLGLRQGFKNFVKMVQKISKHQGKALLDPKKKDKLKKALKKTKNIYSRAWLLAQIEAI